MVVSNPNNDTFTFWRNPIDDSARQWDLLCWWLGMGGMWLAGGFGCLGLGSALSRLGVGCGVAK